MPETVLDLYRRRVAEGEIEPDPAQARAAGKFSALARAIETWAPARRGFMSKVGWRAPRRPPRGLYIHGAVGRGKTMLMDLFFESVAIAEKRRDHFHEFMAEVHDAIAAARKSSPGDPIPAVARAIAARARLLCFDELHVADIADAMILGRLFAALFAERVVLVATSNAAPGDLYADGLNRQLFLPFIGLLEARLDVLELEAAKDFRLDKLAGQPLYFTPADPRARHELDKLWDRLTGHHPAAPAELTVKGRTLKIPRASMGCARFSFADLCDCPLGAADYLAIAHAFHTVFIDGVPVFEPQRRDRARRFINLIDTLYDNGTCLAVSADAEPGALCPSGASAAAFQRTASRLVEMRGESYVRERHASLGQPRVSGAAPLERRAV